MYCTAPGAQQMKPCHLATLTWRLRAQHTCRAGGKGCWQLFLEESGLCLLAMRPAVQAQLCDEQRLGPCNNLQRGQGQGEARARLWVPAAGAGS